MITPPKSVLLLVNGNSRLGIVGADRACKLLEAAGVKVIARQPKTIESCRELIWQHKKKVDAVLLGGGDGTMHSAACALLDIGLPFGILPLGTANDLARTLRIPRELSAAVDVILKGETAEIYLGRLNGEIFFNIANIGLGVGVNQKLRSGRKQSFGIFSYAEAVTRVVRRAKSFDYTLELDGKKIQGRSIQLAIGNGRFYGGGMKVSHKADLRAPNFFIYSVKPQSLRKLIKIIPRVALGRFKAIDGVETFEGKHIELKTDRVKHVYADGEHVTFTPSTFTIEPKKLRVFSPIDRVSPMIESQSDIEAEG